MVFVGELLGCLVCECWDGRGELVDEREILI